MAWWVRWRGSFGPEASALLRSLSPVVLGLGGLFLGTLIVLATMPSVPIDDDLPVALSSGLPVDSPLFRPLPDFAMWSAVALPSGRFR